MSEYKKIHDLLLEKMPSTASHDSDSCPMCNRNTAASEEEKVSAEEKIYSQDQLDKLVQAAVDGAVAEAKREADAELLHANEQLEELNKTLAERNEAIAAFEAETAEREENERVEALATERVEKIREVASFTDEQIAARRERWAKMDEEEFEALRADYRDMGSASGKEKKSPSKFDGTRQTAGEDKTELSAVRELFGLAVGGE